MTDYKAPLRDLRFVLNEVWDYPSHYANLPGGEEATPEMVEAVFEEIAKFCENELAPLYRVGDVEGCTRNEDGSVNTPSGFKEAYQKFIDGGWPALSTATELGGQGLPESVGTAMTEMMATANWSWSMYPGLSHGAKHTITSHGTEQQKAVYLSRLVDGSWTGTMCLTESHCGTDLGMLRTKAELNVDGSYRVTGTKIFISSGEHDMAENIVHIVLARLPDAPQGTKGISLFIVPKFIPDSAGGVGERNAVVCGSIEHKMGIHGNSTCVMNFDGAKGFLLGEINRGLNHMFTFMNAARVGTSIQGLAHAELSFQKALVYAKERLQMRALSGPKNPQGPADPIIVHPDVRRMLLTIKAFREGGRAMLYFMSKYIDINHYAENAEERTAAENMLAFLTPISKAFMTEVGYESANLGMQVFGGHGYISEWGMEQNVRDSRISMLYEGTTGVQAIDLLGRKVLGSGGELLKNFTKIIHEFCRTNIDSEEMHEFIKPLQAANKEWGEITMHIGAGAMNNPDEAGAAAVDYLMYSGYNCFAYFWAMMAKTALDALKTDTTERDFYTAKIQTARFFFQRLLPRNRTYIETIKSGANNLMDMQVDHFIF